MNHTKQSHPYPAEPLKEIWVKGDPKRIGREHAIAVGEAFNKGMPRFYYEFWQRMSEPKTTGRLKKLGMHAAQTFLRHVVIPKLQRQIPAWALERIEGACEVSGRKPDEMAMTLILPDLFPLFSVWVARFYPELFVQVEPPPLFGCSSFFSRGDKFLFGRNLDFPGVAYWDRFPVLQVTAPEDKLRYIAFTSAGVPFGGITGVNEDQISVALHQHYSRSGSISGKLPFLIAEQVLMEARSVEEALAIISRYPVATSWAFLVADGKTRKAVIYECHARGGKANFLTTDHLSHANFYQTPECRRVENATSVRMNWDNYCRKNRLGHLLEAEGSALTPERAVQVLSDHYDPFWGEEKPFNRVVSQVYNIQSVVMDLEAMTAWVAEGDAPIHIRQYQKYDLGALFAGRSGKQEGVLPGYQFQSEDVRRAKEKYILSFVSACDGDYSNALEGLGQSLSAHYTPEAGLIAGVLKLKKGQFAEGRAEFEKGKAFIERKCAERGKKEYPPEYFETLIYLARSLDLVGARGEAEKVYDLLLQHPSALDSNHRRIATARKKYQARHLDSIMMPYSSYIPFQ